MKASSVFIPAGEPLPVNLDAQAIDDPAVNHSFRIVYLEELAWKIDRQQSRLDRFEFLTGKAADLLESMAEIRSDPEGDGITRDERHDLHHMRAGLDRALDRIEAMPDYGTLTDRLMRLEMDFLHKSDEWDLRL